MKINIDDMEWHLFLDDERFPATMEHHVFIARNFGGALDLLEQHGKCPTFISFDHDLGPNEKTGYDFAKWLVERDMDKRGKFIPRNFDFYVHSQNPPGKANIEEYLKGYLKARYKIYYA